jgi:hypothetical protein
MQSIGIVGVTIFSKRVLVVTRFLPVHARLPTEFHFHIGSVVKGNVARDETFRGLVFPK